MKQSDTFKRPGNGGQDWAKLARDAIAKVHRSLPRTVSLHERMTAIDAAYPFGVRAHYPYKIWCRERRSYLIPYGYVAQNGAHHTPRPEPKGTTS